MCVYFLFIFSLQGSSPIFLGCQENMWTCENNTKARASHSDMLDEGTCRFTDVEAFIDSDTLSQMKKLTSKNTVQRFKKWLALAKKGKLSQKAFCTRHLKMCSPQLFPEHSGCIPHKRDAHTHTHTPTLKWQLIAAAHGKFKVFK